MGQGAVTAIVFGNVSSPGETGRTSKSRLINCILEQLQDGSTNHKRAPGLKRFITSAGGNAHTRGMIAANSNTLLVVYNGKVESVSYSAGATISSVGGTLSGTDLVTLARNNAATPDIVCVSPANGAFTINAAGAVSAYPDADVGAPNSVCFGDGYFFFTYGDGSCIASGLNSTSINVLDSIKAESQSGPILRGVFYRGLLFLFTPSTTEVWQDTANPTGFPFSRSAVIPRGLMSANAVAGWEDRFPAQLMWVGPDNIVYKMVGYEPVRISTHDVEHDLQSLADKTEVRCFVAMNNGHPFFYVKSSEFTWAYDLLTSTWQERHSYGLTRWRGEQSCFMWDDWVIGDELTGYGFRLDNRTYAEDTSVLVWDVTSQPAKGFPNRYAVARADFDFVAGMGVTGGDPNQEGDPQVMVSWSDDGGATFNYPLMRRLGKAGRYGERVTVLRAGQATSYGRQWRLQISDPVYVGLLGGDMSAEARLP